jgi:predicted transcriptional regulator of viral defense system
MTSESASLALLPDTFRYAEALAYVSERQLRRLIEDGDVTAVSRGVYRKQHVAVDDDLLEVAARVPLATLCLRSALARHGLTDDIPPLIDVAVPRGSWTPTTHVPVRWRHFDPATFDVGRLETDVGGGRRIGLYSAERSIIDAFRLRHLDGTDLAVEALRRWLRGGGSPAELLRLAAAFPRTLSAIRDSLEILL